MLDKVQRNLITEFDDIQFKLNSSNIMTFVSHGSRLIIENRYKGRLTFNATIISLELKNLQRNDSGLYECIIRWNQNTTTLMYRLSVLGMFFLCVSNMFTAMVA